MKHSSNATIGYLAPEIPGLSSTFVYNEIFKMTGQGQKVETFSIHRAKLKSYTEDLRNLDKTTTYLYETSTSKILVANISFLFSRPLKYIKALGLLCSDAFKLIGRPRTAAGQVFRFFIGAVLAKYLIEKEVRHLHIHFANVPTDVGMYASCLANISFSVTAHANDIFKQYWLVDEKIERSAFFATISNFNIQRLVAQGAKPEKLKLVRCGVDSTDFEFRPSLKKEGLIKFGFLGRLVEKKGAEFLVHAAEILISKGISNFKIEIAGSGPLLNQLISLVDSKLLNNTIFFKGEIPNSSVPAWLDDLDYFVLPCVEDSEGDMDGIPVALMESMVKGVPVISTEISGIPELVIDGETGLLASPGDAESLAACLTKAISESEDDVRIRVEKANRHVQTNFELATNAEKLLQDILGTISHASSAGK